MAREKRTLHYPNVADDPELSKGMTGLGGPRALLTVPLMRGNQVLGAITLRQSHLKPFTERTVTSKEKLREQLSQVREADYAIADRLMELAVRSIAVPVRNAAGTVVAGINVIVEAGRVSLRDMRSMYLPHLQAAAAELGAQLVP